jgi:hypothetical protein
MTIHEPLRTFMTGMTFYDSYDLLRLFTNRHNLSQLLSLLLFVYLYFIFIPY